MRGDGHRFGAELEMAAGVRRMGRRSRLGLLGILRGLRRRRPRRVFWVLNVRTGEWERV